MNKLQRVTRAICTDIASGKYPAGGKLPTYQELEKIHKVSYITINACIKLLKHSGLVVGRERAGVFVTEKPPILSRFALLMPKDALQHNRYLQTIMAVLGDESAKKGVDFEVFQSFEPHEDNPDYRKVLSQMEDMRIGGVAHVSMPSLPDSCQIQRFPGVPVVNGSTVVHFDQAAYAYKASAYLVSRGKRRIAVLSQDRSPLLDKFLSGREKFQMESPEQWFIPVGMSSREGASNICRILLDLQQGKRPNGLIITDDNLVDHALAGVFRSRVAVPEDLEIVAHCNWPNPVTSVIPIKRIGFDVREAVNAMIDALLKARGRTGLQKTAPISLSPKFEEEFK